MATNTLLTISMVTREALRILENNLTFAKGVNREYDDKFGIEGAKIGDTLNIRKPARFVGRTGATLAVENYTETSVPLQLTTQAGVDISFTSKDLALSLDDFSKRFLKPAMANIANRVDRDGLALYKNVPNSVGTAGTIPTLLKTYLQAAAKMDFEGTPRDGLRSVVIDPNMQVEIVDALKGLFQSSTQIKDQYEEGTMGLAAGFKWSMDQNVNVQTVGPLGGTPLIDGATQSGSSILLKGWTAAAAARLKAGDMFTIAGVYAINPQSRQSTGKLREFVVTADASSTAGGAATISVYPALTLTGAFQTVDSLPADGAAIVVAGAAGTLSPVGLAYHRDAFTLACADLPLPGGVDMASRVSDKQLGLSMRMIRAYDINTDAFPCRIDVLYGWKTIYPELACRIQS